MKLILIAFLYSTASVLAASKVVEKFRVVDEKVVSAHGCSIGGDFTGSIYNTGEFQYTITMKVKLKQTMESYKVTIKKPTFGGKPTETAVNNSAKPANDRYVWSTQSITRIVRSDSETHRQELIKACEAEMLFINTGAYPPPPPKPPEPPKTEVKPVTPVTPVVPILPDPILPDPIVPPTESTTNGLPDIPGPNDSNNPLFPIDIPGAAPVADKGKDGKDLKKDESKKDPTKKDGSK